MEATQLRDLLQAFDGFCGIYGDDTAIYVDGGDDVGFSELQSWSQDLAGQLGSRMGVGEESRVLLLLKDGEESSAQVVSILACLRLGASWVPARAWSKTQRNQLRYIIEESNPHAAIVVGSSDEDETLKVLSELGLFRVVLVNADGSLNYKEAIMGVGEYLKPQSDPETSYVQFTSGSTGGAPKGVKGSSKGLANRILWQRSQFPYEHGELCLKRTPLIFVDSIAEILAPLLSGVPLFTSSDPDDVLNIVSLIKKASQKEVSRLTLLPSQLRIVMDNVQAWESLRYVVVSGEPIHPNLISQFQSWKKANTRASLLSLYGSTEIAADVAFIDLTSWNWTPDRIMIHNPRVQSDVMEVTPFPIGEPIANVEIFLLQERNGQHLLCDNLNAVGEIVVCGQCLASGYLTESSQALSKGGFSSWEAIGVIGKSGQIFRTGDAGFRAQHGKDPSRRCLFWIGRMDNLVKVNGVRVSLEQIESDLSMVSNIPIESVCCVEISLGKIQAYVENAGARRAGFVSSEDVMALLVKAAKDVAHLPYGVVLTDQTFPLTASGKKDRKTLKQLGLCQSGKLFGTKNIEVERMNGFEICKRVLEEVLVQPLHSSHFLLSFRALGGSSLTAVDFLWKLWRQVGESEDLSLSFKSRVKELTQQPSRLLGEDSISFLLFNHVSMESDSGERASMRLETRKCARIEFDLGEGFSWTREMKRCVDASPVLVEGGFILIGSHGGDFVKINEGDGLLVWQKDFGSRFRIHSPSVEDDCNSIWVATYCEDPAETILYNLKTSDGAIVKTLSVPYLVKTRPEVAKERLWLGTTDALISVDKEKGKYNVLRFSEEEEGAQVVVPVVIISDKVDDSSVIGATVFGQVTCFNSENGKIKWSQWFAPVYGDMVPMYEHETNKFDHLLVSSIDGAFNCVNVHTSEILWVFSIHKSLMAPLLFVELEGEKLTYVGCLDKHARAIKVPSGKVVWEQSLDASVIAKPCRTNKSGLIVFATTAGSIWYLDPIFGTTKGKRVLPAEIFSSPVAVPGSDDVIVGCRSNHIAYVLGP